MSVLSKQDLNVHWTISAKPRTNTPVNSVAPSRPATKPAKPVQPTKPKAPVPVRIIYPDQSGVTYRLADHKFSSSQLDTIKSIITKELDNKHYIADPNGLMNRLSSTFNSYTVIRINATPKANPIGYINNNGQWVDEQTDTHLTLKQLDPQSQISVGGPDKLSATDQDGVPILFKTNKEDGNTQSLVDVNLALAFQNADISGASAQIMPNQQVYIDNNNFACDPSTHKEFGA